MTIQLILIGILVASCLCGGFVLAFTIWWLVRRGIPQLFLNRHDPQQAAMIRAGSPLRRSMARCLALVWLPNIFSALLLSYCSSSYLRLALVAWFVTMALVLTVVVAFLVVAIILEYRTTLNPLKAPSVSKTDAYWLVPERP